MTYIYILQRIIYSYEMVGGEGDNYNNLQGISQLNLLKYFIVKFSIGQAGYQFSVVNRRLYYDYECFHNC